MTNVMGVEVMYCSFHPKNPAVVQCNQCSRPLCPACDHRIRGFPFCQDCIVTGVELLRQHAQSSPSHVLRRKSSPFVATLLSFVPGLGAAYNGQTSKAIVHFAIFASFFQMAVITQGVHFFILGVLGTWLFAAVDACRTAQLMRAGLSPDAEEDVIARRLYGNPFAWGITLILIGTIFLLHTLLGIRLPVRELLPVALVGLGAYMLFDHIRRRRHSDRVVRFDSRRPPPSVVATSFEPRAVRSGETTQFSRRESAPIQFERRT
ncbi:MAG TPA: B-box zinc finger protein [Pyrinomonadaceae bacterium]|nr:B-box zinc finger protein [Pyrinomonadaceae bacterium]